MLQLVTEINRLYPLGHRQRWSRRELLIARYRRSRLYLWKTTGHSPRIRFKTTATVSPNDVSEPEANLLAARTVKAMKPIR
jgi:hypothetical protein